MQEYGLLINPLPYRAFLFKMQVLTQSFQQGNICHTQQLRSYGDSTSVENFIQRLTKPGIEHISPKCGYLLYKLHAGEIIKVIIIPLLVFFLLLLLFFSFVLRLNVPVNNFSVMSGQSQHFLGLTSTVGS